MIKQVRGTVRVSSQPGQGTRFQLQLPLTLSVVRTLLAEVGGEPYAFPLARIVRTLKVLEGPDRAARRPAALRLRRTADRASSRRIKCWKRAEPAHAGDELSVIVLGDASHTYGLVVDRFLGERELVVQPLDRAARQDQGHRGRRADGGRFAGVDRRHRRPDSLDGQARVRRAPEPGAARRRPPAAARSASECSWSTTRSPCANWSASCSAIAGTTSRSRWTAWTAGMPSGPAISIWS